MAIYIYICVIIFYHRCDHIENQILWISETWYLAKAQENRNFSNPSGILKNLLTNKQPRSILIFSHTCICTYNLYIHIHLMVEHIIKFRKWTNMLSNLSHFAGREIFFISEHIAFYGSSAVLFVQPSMTLTHKEITSKSC